MSDQPAAGRPVGEPRLDVHNSNVDQDSAEAGRCGTLDLRSGRVCRLPALHPDGCDFEAPDADAVAGHQIPRPGEGG